MIKRARIDELVIPWTPRNFRQDPSLRDIGSSESKNYRGQWTNLSTLAMRMPKLRIVHLAMTPRIHCLRGNERIECSARDLMLSLLASPKLRRSSPSRPPRKKRIMLRLRRSYTSPKPMENFQSRHPSFIVIACRNSGFTQGGSLVVYNVTANKTISVNNDNSANNVSAP